MDAADVESLVAGLRAMREASEKLAVVEPDLAAKAMPPLEI